MPELVEKGTLRMKRAVADDAVYRSFERQTKIKNVVRRAMADLAKPYEWDDGLFVLFNEVGKAGLEPSGYDILYAVRQVDRGEEAAIVEMLTDMYLEEVSEPARPLVGGEGEADEPVDEDIEFQ